MEAVLENMLHPEAEEQQLCSMVWSPDRNMLCKNLEEAVYSNPRLLDDFATRIIIYDIRTLFVPTEEAEKKAGGEEELYRVVYEAEPRDIMSDRFGDITAVWSQATGIKSFLNRTFPGARITCNLMEKVRGLISNLEEGEEKVISEDIRQGEVDLILTQGLKLLSASTHAWEKPEDIDHLKKKLMEAYEDYKG